MTVAHIQNWRGRGAIVVCGSLLSAGVAGIHGGATATAGNLAAPSVSECARLERSAPPFRHSLLAATVFCMRPASIRATATVKWTTCPTTPREDSCQEGAFGVSFHSTARGFGASGPDSWGGENYPGAGIYSLPGTGTFSCEGHTTDQQRGGIYQKHSAKVALRDQAAGFAADGSTILVTTSVSPGFHSRLGRNAAVRLGQFDSCIFAQLPIGPEAVRAVWPGKSVSISAVSGSSTRIRSSGSFTRSLPAAALFDTPGVKIQALLRWSSSVVIVPALKR